MTVLNDYFALYPRESFAPINTNHADFTIKGNNTNELGIKTGSKGKVDILFKVTSNKRLTVESPDVCGCITNAWKGTFNIQMCFELIKYLNLFYIIPEKIKILKSNK